MTSLDHHPTGFLPRARVPVLGLLAAWFGAAYALGAAGVFRAEDSELPLALVAAAVLPSGLFLAAYRLSAGLRAWVEELDLALVVGVQAWRVIGVSFLLIWGLGVLPGSFAIAAGYGDVAVGILAMAAALLVARRAPGWRRAAWAVVALGLLDFLLAFATAILSDTGRLLNFAGAPTADAMEALPLVLIPAFGVPFFTLLHVIAWIKLRREA